MNSKKPVRIIGKFLLIKSELIPAQVGVFIPGVKLLFHKTFITKFSLYWSFRFSKDNSASLTSKFSGIYITFFVENSVLSWQGNNMLLIPFKLASLLRGFLIYEVGLIWNNVFAVSCAASIPANDLVSEWLKFSIAAM